jgi:hypothetical protein
MGTHGISHAGSAEVLPKGVFKTSVKYSYYFTIDKRFDPDGHEEDLAADYNTSLDSSVFPALGLVEAGFAMLPGSANIGDSVVDFEYDFDDLIFTFQYGLTDKLTVGVRVPHYWNKNTVDARVDTTNATVGFNPDFGTPGHPFEGLPLIPVSLGGIQDDALAAELAQDALAQEFGFKRVETWSGSGLSDIEVGGRYQYLKTENWRLAFTGGVRLPTGDTDDPDNLVDIGFGEGAYALLFRFNNDYTGIKNLVLNATFRYDLVLPDEETQRVSDDVNQPLTPNREKVDRDLGDVFELEGSGTYEFAEGFSLSLLYMYSFKLEDDVSGDMGFAYKSLEDETDQTYHDFIATLSYSTIPLFKAEKFPLPLTASLEYENVFAGSDNFLKQEILTFELAVLF